jgi:hypothetical protein
LESRRSFSWLNCLEGPNLGHPRRFNRFLKADTHSAFVRGSPLAALAAASAVHGFD